MDIKIFEVTPFLENCIVAVDGGEALVVDPGEAPPRLIEALDGLDVKLIVNTHGHCDHCGGNAGVKAATGAELAIHRDDLPLLEQLEAQGRMFGCAFPPSPAPDRFLEDGQTLHVGQTVFEVVHAPGHAPGHIVLKTEGLVIVGDVLFAGSIGRTDLPGGNYQQLLASIKDKLLVLPDDTTVVCGHGPATTIGRERASNPFCAGL